MNIDDWMVDTITYCEPTGTADAFGQPARGQQLTLPCRVQGGAVVSVGSQNQLKQKTTIYSASPLPIDSQVWLPGDDTSDPSFARHVLTVNSSSTKTGDFTLYKIELQ